MNKNPLECSSNIFLHGNAGTGKTYLVNDYVSKHPDDTLLCASTGTAAVNIGGVTAHRLFSIPVPAAGGNPEKVTPSKLTAFANASTIILDEVSLLRNDAFSFMIRVIRKAEKLYGKKYRLIVVGDFSQLPPIVTKKDESLLARYGFDKSGFAFTAKEWNECKFKSIELTETKRQSDLEFIENLALARHGDDKCIPYFNSFVGKPIDEENAVYICGTNAEADRVNTEYLNSIDTPAIAYQAEKYGITGKDLPCDDIVLLKVGAKVMFTANDTVIDADGRFNDEFGDTGRYTNGMFAEVLSADAESVTVRTETGKEIVVKKHKWSIYNYHTDKATMTLQKKEIGWIKQIPLKIAKAMTIHKSQGKTFSHVILSPKVFSPGQCYVALSRVSSPDGLSLTEPVTPDDLQIHKTVKKFYDGGNSFEITDAQKRKQAEVEKKQTAAGRKKKTTRITSAKTKITKSSTTKKKTTAKKAVAKKTAKAVKKSSVKTSPKKRITVKRTTRKTGSKK